MSKFVDLDLDRKTQFLLNVKVQSLMAHYISEQEGMEVEEILTIFLDRAADVLTYSEVTIDEHLKVMDQELENCIKNEAQTIVKVEMN